MLLSLAQIGKGMHNLNRRLANRWYRKEKYCSSQVYHFAETTTIGFIGIFIFIIAPSVIISQIEGWKFDEGVYFAVVSLSTVGFGDYVAGTCGLLQYCTWLFQINTVSNMMIFHKIPTDCVIYMISYLSQIPCNPVGPYLNYELRIGTTEPCAKFQNDWTTKRDNVDDRVFSRIEFMIRFGRIISIAQGPQIIYTGIMWGTGTDI